jgi:hypothetical protein
MPHRRTRVDESFKAQVARLSAILEEQRQELDELRRNLILETPTPTLPRERGREIPASLSRERGTEISASRRDLLRLAGAAVAGAAGTVALQAIPVSAATNGSMILGVANDANATTDLHPTPAMPAANPLFHVDVSSASNGAVGLLVAGANNGDAAVLQGSGTGSGLSASSNLGSAVSGQAGGGPTSYGVVGTAGAGLTSIGVVGNAGPGNASAGVLGNAGGALSSAGVVGAASVGYGVFGQASSGIDMIAGGNGRLAQVPFSLGGAGAPNMTPGAGVLEIVREDDGSVWVSRAQAGTPIGTLQAAWKRLNAVRVDAADGTGNPFVAARVLDTRNGTGTGTHTGPLLPGQIVDFGSFTGANGIPTDAIGLIGNLTAVASDAAGNPALTFAVGGWLALTPGGVSANPANPVSNLNYGGSVNAVPNFFMVGFGTGVNAGKLRIQNGGNTKVHVLLDVFGLLQ